MISESIAPSMGKVTKTMVTEKQTQDKGAPQDTLLAFDGKEFLRYLCNHHSATAIFAMGLGYHKAIFPATPKSSVAVAIPKA